MRKLLILVSSIFVILVSLGCETKDEKSTAQEAEPAAEQRIVSDTVQPVKSTAAPEITREVKESANQVTSLSTENVADGVGEQKAENAGEQEQEQQTIQDEAVDSVKGSIFILDQDLLPENGVVTIVLEDISVADSPAEVVSQQTFSTSGMHVPFDFELKFDPNKIKQTRQYNVRVRVEVEGQLRFTTDKIYSLITDDDNTKEINIELIGV